MGELFWAESLGREPPKEPAQKGPPILGGLHCALSRQVRNEQKKKLPFELQWVCDLCGKSEQKKNNKK